MKTDWVIYYDKYRFYPSWLYRLITPPVINIVDEGVSDTWVDKQIWEAIYNEVLDNEN